MRRAEEWLAAHSAEPDPVAGAVAACGIPEPSLKRRFKVATGVTLMDYSQNLRVEAAKRMLETGSDAVEEIAAAVGYGNHAFFRRLFRRCTGLTPGMNRRMVSPVLGIGA